MNTPAPTADLSRPLDEREIDALSAALEAIPEAQHAFDVSMLEGYLVGVLLQPTLVMPGDWLPPIFGEGDGDEPPAIGADHAQAARTVELIMRHYNTLAAHIMAREPFDPIVWAPESDDGAPATREEELDALWAWALGFDEALARFPSLIELADQQPDLDTPLEEFLRHLPLDPDAAADDEPTRALRRVRDDLDREAPLDGLDHAIERLVDAVLDIAEVTRPRNPVVRAQPKVGRNDPCPCGSGRKYKQCHGREDA